MKKKKKRKKIKRVHVFAHFVVVIIMDTKRCFNAPECMCIVQSTYKYCTRCITYSACAGQHGCINQAMNAHIPLCKACFTRTAMKRTRHSETLQIQMGLMHACANTPCTNASYQPNIPCKSCACVNLANFGIRNTATGVRRRIM